MSRRLTGDPLPKIVPDWFNSSGSFSKNENVAANKDLPPKLIRPGGRIHPGYIDDQALVFTRYLLPDTYGCPRFRFSRFGENESKNEKAAQKNPLIDSYYPILNCDNSEDQESQKTYSELPNIKKPANRGGLNNVSAANAQSGLKPPIDSRTFTIYSCKSNSTTVPEFDNPQPEGQVDLEKSCETSSGLECFSELHKRIAKLEEKLQHTLEKSIEINDKKRQKSGSVQKLFRMVSGVLDRNGKSKVERTPDSDKSDTEDELRNIKKRLQKLEIKLKKGKNYLTRNQVQSTTNNNLLLKGSGNNEFCKTSKIILKESDYTEPLHSDSELYPKVCLPKNEKITVEEKANQVKPTILSKYKKRNLSKKIPKVSDNNQTTEKEGVDKEVVLVNFNNTKVHCDGDSAPNWNRKFKKRRRKKSRNLCKKNSKTNILTEENRNVNENVRKQELADPWTPHQNECWGRCSCPQCPYSGLSSSMPLPPESINSSLRPCYEDPKTKKLQKSLYFFKPRQNIKMPVLFEEIIAKPKLLSSSSNTPKLSMRFVLTRESKNPLVTLRKLVKKLSQTHPSITKDQ